MIVQPNVLLRAVVLLFVFTLSVQIALAQSKGSQRDSKSLTETCYDPVFSFILNNSIYADGDKAYVCPNSLPDTLQVVDDSETAITFSTTWSGAQAISGNPSKAKIDVTHFTDNYAHARCSFVDGLSVSHEIELHIYNNVTAMFGGPDSLFTYCFDSNNIVQYPTYGVLPRTPYKFIEAAHHDSINVKINPERAFYAAQLRAQDVLLTITPNILPSHDENISLAYGTLSVDTIETTIKGCSTDPELRVFIGAPITKTIDFIYLCNSSGCPSAMSITTLLSQANEVLNQTGFHLVLGGVYYDTVAIMHPTFGLISYDFAPMNGVVNAFEQNTMHQYYDTLTSSPWSSDYLAMLVPDLGGSSGSVITGRATPTSTGLPGYENSLCLDVVDCVHGSTLAHEIGHACFALWHPESTHVDNPNPSVVDKRNFMYGTRIGRTNNIRAYQMKEIHRIR